MDVLRRPLGAYVVGGVVLGLVSLVLALAKVKGLAPLVDILIAATAFAAGFAARARAGHPAWSGAAAGAAYGVVSGLRAFLQKTTASELKAVLQRTHRSSPLSTSQLLAITNSPGAHIASLAVSAIVFALLCLVLGAVAGAIAGGREQQRRAV